MDYSRFDHIGSSSSSDDDDAPLRPRHPPPAVRDDLEDYFRRLDERLAAQEAARGPVDVARFGADELDALLGACSAPLAAPAECAICLGALEGEAARLPCAARHAFHGDCVRGWLRKNTHCPLCRVDLLPIHRARAGPARREPPPSPRALGYTRDGGTISRWEPAPPPDVPRPDYVPAHLRDSAGYVEVEYPNQGVARVWRVARGSHG